MVRKILVGVALIVILFPMLAYTAEKVVVYEQLKAKERVVKEKVTTVATTFYTNPQKAIFVSKVKRSFKIILKSNPTTGYVWVLSDINRDIVKPIKHVYHAPPVYKMVNGKKEFLAGAPGYEVWSFRLNRSAFIVPGITEITLNYMRAWDLGHEAKKIFVIMWQ